MGLTDEQKADHKVKVSLRMLRIILGDDEITEPLIRETEKIIAELRAKKS